MESHSEVQLKDYLEEQGLGEAQDPAKVTNGINGEETSPAVKRNKVWIKFFILLLRGLLLYLNFEFLFVYRWLAE